MAAAYSTGIQRRELGCDREFAYCKYDATFTVFDLDKRPVGNYCEYHFKEKVDEINGKRIPEARTDLDRLDFLLNTGYHIGRASDSKYFIHPWPGYFLTPRIAVDNAIRCFDEHNGVGSWQPMRGGARPVNPKPA